MSVMLEHYASLASEAIKEKLKELKANILNDDENDSLEHNGEEEDKMEVDEDGALKTKLSSSLQCKEINTDILDTMVCKTAMPSSLALQPGFEKLDQLPNKLSKRQEKKQKRIERSKTKGKDWFHMQAAEQTEEKMNELKIIQMRGILDSKTFYKRTENRPGVLPKFFQSGTVIEAPTDYYSSRIPKKQRKKTLVDELLADVEFQKYRKRKYAEVASKTQGHKKFKKNKKSN